MIHCRRSLRNRRLQRTDRVRHYRLKSCPAAAHSTLDKPQQSPFGPSTIKTLILLLPGLSRFPADLSISVRRNHEVTGWESKTEVICKAMKNTERYRHLRVDWGGQSITLCGVEGEDIGAGQALCPDCAQVGEALNVCGLGPGSLRELLDTLRVFGPSEVKAKMEALRGLGVRMDMQDRSQLN